MKASVCTSLRHSVYKCQLQVLYANAHRVYCCAYMCVHVCSAIAHMHVKAAPR